jgi:23S rRNA pseudouridine2605 synthase
VASRRAVEELIVRGRVRIDGKVVKELGTIVADGAEVEVDHKRVMPAKPFT